MGIHSGEYIATVTQLGECQTEDLEVAGSSPAHRTIIPFSQSEWQLLELPEA